MKISKSIPYAAAMAIPRMAISYAVYVTAPVLMINWTSRRTWTRVIMLLGVLGFAMVVNYLLGLRVSITAWVLELALILPFLAAVLGFQFSRHFDGRELIRILNFLVFVTSTISMVRLGFPFKLPYIHYLPDFYNGGFGTGGAKIVTVIGFFGLAEALSRRRGFRLRGNWSLLIALSNFLMPNFILGMVAGVAGLLIYVRRNRALLFAGAALALLIVPYLQFRAETKNNAFAEHYGSNPKIYAFVLVGDMYLKDPQTLLLGSGLGQFSSQPAIWSSPINDWVGGRELPPLPGFFAGDAHIKYIAPTLLRFRDQRYAIESSANKPYSGISLLLAELGLPMTLLILYSAFRILWRGDRGEFGKAAFLFLLAMNFVDPQVDSPWFGVMLLCTVQAIRTQEQQRMRLGEGRRRESGIFLPPPETQSVGSEKPRPATI